MVYARDLLTGTYSLILNPQLPNYRKLKDALQEIYEDAYWDEDAIFLERNSRDFKTRVSLISQNTESICEYLRSQSYEFHKLSNPNAVPEDFLVRDVYYPKWVTRENYDALKLPGGGYGGLFSVTFTSPDASIVFFDNLACEKGPSLGTNFTLACPYTILAHYTELDWAQEYGVDPYLVRVSIGLENLDILLSVFYKALESAATAVGKTSTKVIRPTTSA